MPTSAAPLYVLNKPYGVLSQFTPRDGNPGLASLVSLPGYRPIGRLDHDSEGLLLLTNEKRWIARLASPEAHVAKRYVVQVEGEVSSNALAALQHGPRLNDGPTRPAQVRPIAEPGWLWPRDPPIRQRRNIPTSWIEIRITEGRNRQVRRMTAAVGLPTLRLIRIAVGDVELGSLGPGQMRTVSRAELPGQLP
jgi:23S rRNA pseudouridine2457 synthase